MIIAEGASQAATQVEQQNSENKRITLFAVQQDSRGVKSVAAIFIACVRM